MAIHAKKKELIELLAILGSKEGDQHPLMPRALISAFDKAATPQGAAYWYRRYLGEERFTQEDMNYLRNLLATGLYC